MSRHHGIRRPWLKKGSLLREDQKKAVKDLFIHRYTGDHTPDWVSPPFDGHPHYESDDEWLANTTFQMTRHGELDRRCHYCFPLVIPEGIPPNHFIIGNASGTRRLP